MPQSTNDGGAPESHEDRTPKGILKDGNKDSLTPNRQNSKDFHSGEYGSKIPSGDATRDINTGEPSVRPKIDDGPSRSNAFKSEDRVKKGELSVGSRERLPPKTANE